jgi:hypothetical protein
MCYFLLCRVEDGGAKLARRSFQVLVIFDVKAGPVFLRFILRQRLCGHDATREPHRSHRNLPIYLVTKVVQPDFRIVRGIRRLDAHPSTRARPQVAHARRDCREAVQRIAELVERERLHVPFDVRRRLRGIAPRERAGLRRGHRQRPGAEHEVLERHRRLAEHAVGDAIQRAHVAHLVLHADLQVVVQVLADARQVVDDLDLMLFEQISRPDARDLQQLRRSDGACRQDGLSICLYRIFLIQVKKIEADAVSPAET